MRVTAETKAATRQRILAAARQLFLAKGFDACTTRDIADSAGIATGTLFNYFATKEAILASLAVLATEGVHGQFEGAAPQESHSRRSSSRLWLPCCASSSHIGSTSLRFWRQRSNPLAAASGDEAELFLPLAS